VPGAIVFTNLLFLGFKNLFLLPSKPSAFGFFGVLSSFLGIDFTLLGLLTIASFRILCLLGTLFELSYLGISSLRI